VIEMTKKTVVGKSKNYELWTTDAWDKIMLRDFTSPEPEARAPDLFFDNVEQMMELRNLLSKTIRGLKDGKV
jgi:hypothetical protein